MMFFDCPAWLDEEGAVRCGLPAEVRCRYTVRSTDGLLESAMIQCPGGHGFNGPIESLIWDGRHTPDQGAVCSRPTSTDGALVSYGIIEVSHQCPCRPSLRAECSEAGR